MSKAAGGARERHRRDVLELLAQARPASLDPGPSGLPPEEFAARLTAAHGVPGAETAGTAETPGRRYPRRGLLAGAGLTVTAAGAATAVLLATAGGSTPPQRRAPQPVLLTAATVRQVATASRSALARSGRATVSYTSTQDGMPGDSSTDVITFSGKNWNDVSSQTFPGAGGRPGHTQTAINRIVNGELYLYIAARTRRLQWYHDTNPSGHPSVNIPDPRTVLRALEPSARFEVAGYQVIGGVRVRELRATDLSHLPGQDRLVGVFAAGGHVTSLEVWVDGHGVVHRLSLTSAQINEIYPVSADNVRKRPDGRLIFTVPNRAMAAQMRARLKRAPHWEHWTIRIAPPGSGAPRRQVQVSRLTVTFSAIGQPQHITAPRHAIQQYGRG